MTSRLHNGHRVKPVIALAVAMTLALVSGASGHYAFRIVGTVKKVTAAQIDVKPVKEGAIVEIDLDQRTKITRDRKPVALAQIKVGGSVVVDALGDSILDLTATEIKLVPAIPTAAKPEER